MNQLPITTCPVLKTTKKTNRILIASLVALAILGFFSEKIFWAIYLWAIKPGKARTKIPVTCQVGWWPSQRQLTIDSFRVEIVESKLNLFNNESLFAYSVFGKIEHLNSVRYSIPDFGAGTPSNSFVETRSK